MISHHLSLNLTDIVNLDAAPRERCAEYLNPLKFAPFMGQVEKQVLRYVQDLKETELKRKVRCSTLTHFRFGVVGLLLQDCQ